MRRTTSAFMVATMPAVLMVGVLTGASTATALTPDPSVTAGTLLPVRPHVADPPTLFPYASTSYLGIGQGQQDEYDGNPPIQLRRIGDGSVARTVALDYANRDVLSGSALIHRQPSSVAAATSVVATDIESGEARWTIDVPEAEPIVSTGDTWVLSVLKEGTHDSILRRPGKPTLTVSDMPMSSFGPFAVGDSSGLLVSNASGRAWALDLVTGLATLLFDGQHAPKVYATPTRYFVVEDGSNTSDDVIHWWDRVGSGHGEVTVPAVSDGRGYVAFGSRLASLRAVDSFHNNVEPVDLTTGAREAAVLTNTLEARPVGDGRLAALLTDTPNGRVVLLEDGRSPTTFADLPEIGYQVSGLGIGGGKVVSQYGDPWIITNARTWIGPVDGSAKPQPLTDATGETPGGLVQAAGDAVITFVSSMGPSTDKYRVVWPGGYRDITAFPSSARLGAGGSVLIKSLGGATLEDTRTGAALGSVPDGQPFAVDGRTLWRISADASTLTAHDLDGLGPDRTVRTGLAATCNVQGLQVVGRFGLVRCSNSFFSVDTSEVYQPWKVAYDNSQSPTWISDLVLGTGFATWIHYLTDPNGVVYAVVEAQDLGPGRQVKTYGSAHGLSMPPYPMVAADDRAPRLVYADTSLLVRRVDLDWLSTPATTVVDTAAPQVATLGSPARVSAGPVEATWSFNDDSSTKFYPSGVLDYDVRYQQPVAGQPVADGDWLAPASMSGLTATSVDLPSTIGKDTCWSVRARDRAGNVSTWTTPRCTTVDVTAPTVQMSAPLTPATTSTAAAVAYAGSDPAGVASYDVRYRRATFSGSFGTYATAASATTATRIAVNLAAGYQYCFSVRARDKVGNVSGWTAERCISKVLDDRTLSRSSTAWVKGTGTAYYGSTVTSTTKSGVSLTRAGVKARQVFVLTTTCRTCGSVAVYIGSTKVGTLSMYSSTPHDRVWRSTILSTARSGTLKFVSTTTGKTIRIDAFAIRTW